MIITVRCSCRKVMCQEFCPRGVSVHYPRQTPPRQTHPPKQTPPRQTPPRQTPTSGRHPPGQTSSGQTPPSPDGHCRGRHASYWNAFLCFNLFFIFFLLFSSSSLRVKTSFTRYKMLGMSSHIWCAQFVMVVLAGFGEPASILMIPCSHYSYINTFTVFGKTLISAGHEVG